MSNLFFVNKCRERAFALCAISCRWQVPRAGLEPAQPFLVKGF